MTGEEVLKAFAVHGDDYSEIVFARHRITALKRVAAEYNEFDMGGLRTERVAWADKYAPGPVPVRAQLENGWSADCSGCFRHVTADGVEEDYLSADDDVYAWLPVPFYSASSMWVEDKD